ncbi:MAG TPA: DUF3325 domain-containing protein [Ideonella sp.]|nr:DUF3325 domain-containing protein [Ideonella sp.]
MHELLLWLALAASGLGFASLSLAMDKHWEAVTAAPALPGRHVARLRTLGWGALGASFALAVLRDGWSFGSVLWAMLLTTGAIAVAFTLTWRAHWLRPLAQAASALHIGPPLPRDRPAR